MDVTYRMQLWKQDRHQRKHQGQHQRPDRKACRGDPHSLTRKKKGKCSLFSYRLFYQSMHQTTRIHEDIEPCDAFFVRICACVASKQSSLENRRHLGGQFFKKVGEFFLKASIRHQKEAVTIAPLRLASCYFKVLSSLHMDPLNNLRSLPPLHPMTASVRDYVTAKDHLQYQNLPQGMVAVEITHSNLPAKHLDIRFDLHSSIEAVKEKLRAHIGTPVDYQRLILRSNGEYICEMDDNSRMLGFYSVQSGYEIHVIDTDPFSLSKGGGLTDTSLIQKYTMSEEDYAKRKGTVREFILKKKAEENQEAATSYTIETVNGITVSSRCEVMPGARRGTVEFVGEIPEFKAGYWVGVRFDEPVGRPEFDGTMKGVSYFSCSPGYGTFVRGNNVTVGDFPERDLLDEDEDEI